MKFFFNWLTKTFQPEPEPMVVEKPEPRKRTTTRVRFETKGSGIFNSRRAILDVEEVDDDAPEPSPLLKSLLKRK